jgi:osmotically inducible protein OsmC
VTTRTSTAHWNGDLKSGSGEMALGSGRYEGPFSAASRFEDGEGTNPEELLAAAHAGCFSMALSNMLASEGHTPDEIRSEATAHLEMVDGNPTITKVELTTVGKVPGIDADTFTQFAEKAKDGCPVSKLFAGAEITLDASFES